MRSDLRTVVRLPLERLWCGDKVFERRQRDLSPEEIKTLIQQGRVEFVVADVGKGLEWVDPTDCFTFYKREIKPHLAGSSRIELEQFPGEYCYFASDWGEAMQGCPLFCLNGLTRLQRWCRVARWRGRRI